MVSAYWTGDDLLPFARKKRQITADFCEDDGEMETPGGGEGDRAGAKRKRAN